MMRLLMAMMMVTIMGRLFACSDQAAQAPQQQVLKLPGAQRTRCRTLGSMQHSTFSIISITLVLF